MKKTIFHYKNAIENISLKIGFALISLQLIHFYWLISDVILKKILDQSFFIFPQNLLLIFIIVDYLEIPAITISSFYYAIKILKRFEIKILTILIFLLLQVFHLFWLTDEVIYKRFFERRFLEIPLWLVWTAILIDFLEIPAIIDLGIRIKDELFLRQ